MTNTGERAGAEIVQIYVAKEEKEDMADNKPFRQLKEFDKVYLEPRETKTVSIKLPVCEFTFWS